MPTGEIRRIIGEILKEVNHANVIESFFVALTCLCFVAGSGCFLQAADADDSWRFHLAPYAWLAGQDGTLGTIPGLPAADVNVDFYDDVLGNINGALMLVGEARKGRLGVYLDLVYTDIEMDQPLRGTYFTTLTSQTKSWIVSVAGFYNLVETDKAFLDALAGLRYWNVDSELAVSGGPLGFYNVDNSEDWIDPFIGLKGRTMLGSSKFFISGSFLIGGFGAGSDLMWDLNGNVGYEWTASFSTLVGYRYLDVDYDDNGFTYDVAQDGIILGLSWFF